MVYDILKTIGTMISEDQALVMSQNIQLALQNAELKAQAKQSHEDILNELKSYFSQLNEQLKNEKITSIVEMVGAKLVELQRPNKYKNYQAMLNEYNMSDVVTRLKESEAYADPILRGFVDNMNTQLSYAKVPHFKYIPVVVEGLKKFESMPIVKEEVDKMEKYVKENHKKLLVLESIYEMERLPGKMYNPHIELLKDMLFEGKISSVRLNMGYSGLYKTPLVENLINGLANVERTETGDNMDVFVGSNNPFVKVHNYIGPVLKEEKSITVYIDRQFVRIAESNGGVNLEHYTTVIENSDNCFIGVLKENQVKPEFVELVKAYSKLPGKLTTEGVKFDFKRFNAEFRLNENDTLDIYLNSTKMEEGIDANFTTKLSLLRPSEKENLRKVIENVENIFSIDFVKSVVNEKVNREAPGNGFYIINVNEAFYVYEITNDLQRKIYKMDDYQLTNYMHEGFKVDASNIFNIRLSEKVEALKQLKNKQTVLESEIQALETNVEKINKVLGTDIQEKHEAMLNELKEEINAKLIKANEQLVICKEDLLAALQPQELNEDNKLSAGDTVKLTDGTMGRVVSTAPSLNGYIIVTESGESRTITNEEIDMTVKPEAEEAEPPAEESTEEVVEETKINEEEAVAEQQPTSDDMKPVPQEEQTQETQETTDTEETTTTEDEILEQEEGVTEVTETKKEDDEEDEEKKEEEKED